MTQKTNSLDTILQGAVDGARIGFDPIGATYSYYTNDKTVGGFGLKGVDSRNKSNPNANYNSLSYKTARVAGTALGLSGQISTYGGIQALMLLFDYINYKVLKKSGKEKF